MKNRIKAIFCSLVLVATVGCAAVDPYADLPKSVREARMEIQEIIYQNNKKTISEEICKTNSFLCENETTALEIICKNNDFNKCDDLENLMKKSGAKNDGNISYVEYRHTPPPRYGLETNGDSGCLFLTQNEERYLISRTSVWKNRNFLSCAEIAKNLTGYKN